MSIPEIDRATRAALYGQWIKDDAAGLLAQLSRPLGTVERKILLEARANAKAALELIEHRLATHQEPA